jgi:class 3 adenylate cyclase
LSGAIPSTQVIDGERKNVTALFADIKGSMELMESLDPEEARAIVDPALNLMIDAVRRYDGYIVQSTGDGIFALFGAPLSTRNIHNVRSMQRSACKKKFAAMATVCALKGKCRSRYELVPIPVRLWCGR